MDIIPASENTQAKVQEWYNQLDFYKESKCEELWRKVTQALPRCSLLLFLPILVGVPFAIIPLLRLVESYVPIQGVDDVSYKEWIGFLGSYLGGVITLLGVYFSMQYMKSSQMRQERVSQIDKECEVLSKAMQEMDVHFCKNAYEEHQAIKFIEYNQYICELRMLQQKISQKIAADNNMTIFIEAMTDMFRIYPASKKCDKCNLYKIKKEFTKLYNSRVILKEIMEQLSQHIYTSLQDATIKHIELLHPDSSDYKSKLMNEVIEKKLAAQRTLDLQTRMGDNIDEQLEVFIKEIVPKMNTLIKLYNFEAKLLISKKCM